MKNSQLKHHLDHLFLTFNRKEYLETDPISLVHRYHYPEDQEVVALIASLFAYGNVQSIKNTVQKIIVPLGSFPAQTLRNMNDSNLKKMTQKIYYRFYSSQDIFDLLHRIRTILGPHGSLGVLFKKCWDGNVITSLSKWRHSFIENKPLSTGTRFMFADPRQSAAKRWHLFLRWMVRKDEIDLGLWDFIPKSALIQPLDTHLFSISKTLGLTRRNTPSLPAALEITNQWKQWDPEDPIKYDFALCRLGILKKKDLLYF